jgi:hypothetical protein
MILLYSRLERSNEDDEKKKPRVLPRSCISTVIGVRDRGRERHQEMIEQSANHPGVQRDTRHRICFDYHILLYLDATSHWLGWGMTAIHWLFPQKRAAQSLAFRFRPDSSWDVSWSTDALSFALLVGTGTTTCTGDDAGDDAVR